jgi:hypothetical protein
VIQLKSVSKRLEDEINKIAKDKNVRDLAFKILNFEIETFDLNKKKYTKEYEEMIESCLRDD